VQEIVVEERVFDLESDIEGCELIDFGNRVPYLVDKKREIF
jgi:hypothetical protein